MGRLLVRSVSSQLDTATAAAVRALADAARATDGVAPLSEQAMLHLAEPDPAGWHLLVGDDDRLAGYAQLDLTNGGGTAELVVHPQARRLGVGRQLLQELLDRAGSRPLQLWAHGERPGSAQLAAAFGFARVRVLWQLGRSLADPLPEPTLPADVEVRTFVPGQDEDGWLEVNTAAFATHPEQGRWTRHDLELREREAWFDPAGFFLAERAGRLVGFHWTKVHTDREPPLGEVYVLGVRPDEAGHGLGQALALVGLRHLQRRGLGEVMLYVDDENRAAMRLYERLGFSRWSADVCYRRAPARPSAHGS